MPTQTLNDLKLKCEDAISHLHVEFAKVQTGRASAGLVEDIMVDSYGAKMPLKGVATITIPEPSQIAIQPWSRDQLTNIEKAIMEADIGLNPQNDGVYIRLNIPPLTEERRKDLVKMIHKFAEETRVSIRNARHETLKHFQSMEKEKEISEDELRGKEKQVQEVVDEYNEKVEEITKKKEGDLMKV